MRSRLKSRHARESGQRYIKCVISQLNTVVLYAAVQLEGGGEKQLPIRYNSTILRRNSGRDRLEKKGQSSCQFSVNSYNPVTPPIHLMIASSRSHRRRSLHIPPPLPPPPVPPPPPLIDCSVNSLPSGKKRLSHTPGSKNKSQWATTFGPPGARQ